MTELDLNLEQLGNAILIIVLLYAAFGALEND
jgi:hypothetical protein